jgi:hypothetical protein
MISSNLDYNVIPAQAGIQSGKYLRVADSIFMALSATQNG